MDWREFERVQQVVDRRLLLKLKSVKGTAPFIGCFMYLYRRTLLGIVIVLLFGICGVISVLNLPGQCNFLLRINHGYICLCF